MRKNVSRACSLSILVLLGACAVQDEKEPVRSTSASLNGTYVGCYTDDANRALDVWLPGSNWTVQACIDEARARGYAYAGLQYYGECFAGNTLGYARAPESECSLPCTANPSEICGGGWRNSIYSTAAPTTTPPGYIGCYTDDSNRALDDWLPGSGWTIQGCIDAARARGYAYAGLQYYGECFGGNTLGYTRAPESDCSMPCTANPSQICGGGWRNSIYGTGVTTPPPTTNGGTLNVVSWNIQFSTNVSALATKLLAQSPDLVMIQEWDDGTLDQLRSELARRTGAQWTRAWDVLTRRTVRTQERRSIGANSWGGAGSQRYATRVEIDAFGKNVQVFATHLDWPPDGNMTNHIENRTKLLAFYDAFSGPRIVGGDLNAWTWGPNSWEGNEQRNTLAALDSRAADVCVSLRGSHDACNSWWTNAGWLPDHVYRSAGLTSVSHTTVNHDGLSDHKLLVVSIGVP
jgi:endonuclease/exonuclease/phosphatase family metal-dependent hydrolase